MIDLLEINELNNNWGVQSIMYMYDKYLYVASGSTGSKIVIYDISVPTAPVVINTINTVNSYYITGVDHYIYGGSFTGMTCYDVSDPLNPLEMVSTSDHFTLDIGPGLVAMDNFLFCILLTGGPFFGGYKFRLSIYDVSDRSKIVLLYESTFPHTSNYSRGLIVRKVDTSNYSIIIGTSDNFEQVYLDTFIWDTNGPIILASSTSIYSPNDISVQLPISADINHPRYIYFPTADSFNNLVIFTYDIENPYIPIQSGVLQIPSDGVISYNRIPTYKNYIFLPDFFKETFVTIDASNPNNLLSVGTIYPGSLFPVFDCLTYGRTMYQVAQGSIYNPAINIYKILPNGLPSSINSLSINQNHYDILPFTFQAVGGYTQDLNKSTINFQISSSDSPYVDYDAVISRDNVAYNDLSTETFSSLVYVPNNDQAKDEHRSTIYVDVIVNDDSGVRSTKVYSAPGCDNFEAVVKSFYIPKFTWDSVSSISNSNSAMTTTTTSTTTLIIGTNNLMWVASENTLQAVLYNEQEAFVQDKEEVPYYNENMGSQVNKVIVNGNRLYVSNNGEMSYYISDIYDSTIEASRQVSVVSSDRGLLSLNVNGYVWEIQSYQGKVIKRDQNTLLTVKEYDGFDSPSKIIWSSYHNCYFVAGTFMLWKLDDIAETKQVVYTVNNYKISDISVSDGGFVCLLFNGVTDSIIRVLKSDLYKFALNTVVSDTNLRFCQICNGGKFYILGEYSLGGKNYSAINYVFDIGSGVLSSVVIDAELAVTTTTTTLASTAFPIQMQIPNGGEQFLRGSGYDIKWLSSKGTGDSVKIELYRKGQLYGVITESTPNTGIFNWNIPSDARKDDRYAIKVTWLTASSGNNSGMSASNFEITDEITTTTTTTTLRLSDKSVGISYDAGNDYIIIMLATGLFGIYDVTGSIFYGMIDSTLKMATSMITQNVLINAVERQSKVRVFVGSQKYYSNKWDSGVIETNLKSMYYGGGDNLQSGETYFVHIQVYDEDIGWSDLQINEFVMPKW